MKRGQLIFEFQPWARVRGGTVTYPVAVALDFVRRCKELDIPIDGLDGFFVTETTTQPSMANSVDYSAGRIEGNRHDLAIEFLAKRLDAGMYLRSVFQKNEE